MIVELQSFLLIGALLVNIVSGMVHEPGVCAMYDNCGKKSFFGALLPCPSNIEAQKPDKESIDILTSICGADFPVDLVCCSKDQVINLQSNLKKVDPLISSCPACRKNFYDFFCEFTCSSNQSMFVNITATTIATDTKKEIVSELTQYVEPESAAKFFDSCKNLKFSATNGYAMDLIGGGAKNYQEFLKFLGDEKPLLGGSPFQMNFIYNLSGDASKDGLILRETEMKNCNDKVYKCACSDCEESCPTLPYFGGMGNKCTIGALPCFSFTVIILLALLICALGAFHVAIAKQKRKNLTITPSDGDFDVEHDPTNYLIVKKNDTVEICKKLSDNLSSNIEFVFESIGFFVARFPGFTIIVSLFICTLLSSGMYWLEFETNPVNLWVSPKEQHLKNYQYFEENFGEWFRIEQIFVSRKDDHEILDWETIKWWFEQELSIQEFEVDDETLSLDEFCFKPLGETCVIESFTQYFYGDVNYLSNSTWKDMISQCTDSPVNCLPTFQQPLKPNLLFSDNDVLKSKAFVVTILLNQDLKDETYIERVEKYETQLKEKLLKLGEEKPSLQIDFSTEISLTEELNKSTNTDINVIIISYLCMFLYASISLGGQIPIKLKLKNLLYTRFQLGLSGIIIILLSVSSSLGFFALIGLKSTLIIAEVIPFLILAIGVDNIFLVLHELSIVNLDEELKSSPLEVRIAKALRNIGPSCLISAVLQVSMFLLAANVDMPAVKNFAFYSAGAVIVNVVLQMTCFVSILTLDQKRLEEGRLDCLPWLKASVNLPENDTEEDQEHVDVDVVDYNFSKLIKKYYAPKILTKTAKPKILTVFILCLGLSLSLLPYIELGLDQKDALPRESYLIDYFQSMAKFLNVGPPIFFVLKNFDLTNRKNQQKICGKFSTCEEYSLANILEQEYERSGKSSIVDPLSNWLDDFLTWLNPNLDQCCRVKKNSNEFCSPNSPSRLCESCYLNHDPAYNITMDGLPTGDEFMYYFNQWIEQPSDPCPLGGKAPYGNAIAYTNTLIKSSYFRTSHGPLRTQSDFINAFKNSLRIVDEINGYQPEKDQLELFAFSPFYIFFVQYENIVSLAFKLLSLAMVIIWIITTILLGSFRVSSILVAVIALIMINIGGVMALWGISLNAISLVNLVICVGLSVEFCIHIARGYVKANETVEENDEAMEDTYERFMNNASLIKDSRTIKTYHALVNIGGSVVGGITLTKFIGIIVLAFTRSKIFEIYYFRMWLSLIFIAVVHSLCLLPVLLSYFG